MSNVGTGTAAPWSSHQAPVQGPPLPPLDGGTGKAMGLLSMGASSAFGPVGMVISGIGAVYGAVKQAQHAKDMQAKITTQLKNIKTRLGSNSRLLRNDIDDINVATAGEIREVGDDMGERIKVAGDGIGQFIKKKRGLKSGETDEYIDRTKERLGQTSQGLLSRVNDIRANKIGSVINPYVQGVESSMAQMDDLNNQFDAYGKQTDWSANIFG